MRTRDNMPEQTERLTLAQAVAKMTPEKLEAWLIHPDQYSVRFLSGHCSQCIVAIYLRKIIGLEVAVGSISVRLNVDTKFVPLPEWSVRFMGRYDMSKSYRRHGALRILRECCPELTAAPNKKGEGK